VVFQMFLVGVPLAKGVRRPPWLIDSLSLATRKWRSARSSYWAAGHDPEFRFHYRHFRLPLRLKSHPRHLSPRENRLDS